jgi:hypothetical protein
MVHLAIEIGKCQNQVHLACTIGIVPKIGIDGSGP